MITKKEVLAISLLPVLLLLTMLVNNDNPIKEGLENKEYNDFIFDKNFEKILYQLPFKLDNKIEIKEYTGDCLCRGFIVKGEGENKTTIYIVKKVFQDEEQLKIVLAHELAHYYEPFWWIWVFTLSYFFFMLYAFRKFDKYEVEQNKIQFVLIMLGFILILGVSYVLSSSLWREVWAYFHSDWLDGFAFLTVILFLMFNLHVYCNYVIKTRKK